MDIVVIDDDDQLMVVEDNSQPSELIFVDDLDDDDDDIEVIEESVRREPSQRSSSTAQVNPPETKKDYNHLFGPDRDPTPIEYHAQVLEILGQMFVKISPNSIKRVATKHKLHLAESFKALSEMLMQIYCKQNPKSKTPAFVKSTDLKVFQEDINGTRIRVLKRPRSVNSVVDLPFDHYLADEIKAIDWYQQNLQEEYDEKLAKSLNEEEYRDCHQLIDCNCCFDSYPFESLVQCTEGHLFCVGCLEGYIKSKTYGFSQSNLKCMDTSSCSGVFPQEMMNKLDPVLVQKFNVRQTQEAVNLAVPNLVCCPKPDCSFAAILDDGVKAFRCGQCGAVTCRECKMDWKDHIGKTCAEVESKDETSVRLKAEEEMSKVVLRCCPKCSTPFVKENGCNKMTCRCGTLSCYLCRTVINKKIGYKHFCQHGTRPGLKCKKCTKCRLWDDPSKAESKIVNKMEKETESKIKQMIKRRKTETVSKPKFIEFD